MAIDAARTARGAVAGAVAATVWAAQQPLDKQAFHSGCDDVELLGKLITRGPGWYPAGLALHVANGAAFGALYSALAPAIPLPGAARGVAVAMAEHFCSWPAVRLSDRFHPARDELPALTGNRRALAQATWRHLLFGLVLGELEHRLNGPRRPLAPDYQADAVASRNGHGRLEDAVAVGGPASG